MNRLIGLIMFNVYGVIITQIKRSNLISTIQYRKPCLHGNASDKDPRVVEKRMRPVLEKKVIMLTVN